MRIYKSVLPVESVLSNEAKSCHYIDSFKAAFQGTTKNIAMADVGRAFFSSGPKWIEGLFILRNKIVGAFGLKTSGSPADRQEQLANFKCEEGEQLGLFKVRNRTKNEVVLGEDDKHLNFRVSLFVENLSGNRKSLTVTTTVLFNNWLGRLYFIPVRPFHKLIVPTMLKAMVRQLEQAGSED